MAIIQGDNGYSVPFIVTKDQVEDLTGAFVEVVIERGGETINKQAIIDDATTGKCHFLLTSSDLRIVGTYSYQWTAYFPDGRIYSGKQQSLVVSDKLSTFTPGTGEETLVIPFATKKELEDLVLEGVTYDDTEIKQELATTVKSINGVTPDANGNVVVEGSGGGTGILSFDTLAELQAAYPNGTTQPVWIVSENAWYYWEGEVIPPADTTAPVLTITPAAGTYNVDQTVTMSASETADIYYTLNGSTPTTASTKYTTPITVSATTTVKAFAKDTAGNESAIQIVVYTIDKTVPDTTAPTVTASPVGGTFTSVQSVTLSANETATIYYTLDGTTPTEASTVYSAPISISESNILKYFAKDTAGNSSTVQTQAYTINIPVDTTPPVLTITPAATFTDTQTVTMSTNESATIWYTLDDSDPVTSGTRVQYTASLTLTETDTIKAYAVDAADNASAVQTVTYTKEAAQVTTLVSDDFNRVDGDLGTALTGQTWDSRGSKIISNQVGFLTSQGSYPSVSIAQSDNILIEMDFTLPTLTTGTISGITARVASASNQAVIWGAKSNGTKLGFVNTLSGASTVPADINFTFVAGQTYKMKMEVTGNVYKTYIDGVLQQTYTDANSIGLTNAKHGFCFYSTTAPRGDNFKITTL